MGSLVAVARTATNQAARLGVGEAGQKVTEYRYSAAGDLVGIGSPGSGGEESLSYTAEGLLAARTTPSGKQNAFASGRILGHGAALAARFAGVAGAGTGVAVVVSATASIAAGDPNIQFSSTSTGSFKSSDNNAVNLDQKPTAHSQKLQNFINSLYKGQGNPNQIGNGTTMDSIRYELETGNPVEGKFHSQKGKEFMNGINKLLSTGTLDWHDEAIARAIVHDIANALAGK